MNNRALLIVFAGLVVLMMPAVNTRTAAANHQQVIEDVLKELKHKDPMIRQQAAGRLGGQVAPPANVIDALMDPMEDTDFRVRANAATARGNFGPHAAHSAGVLVPALHDSDRRVCDGAAIALGKMGRKVVTPLCGVLNHEKKDVKGYAIEALGKIGPEAVGAVTPLTKKFGDLDPVIRLKVIWALSRIGPAAEPDLVHALENKSAVIRWYATTALGRIGGDARTSVPALIHCLHDEDHRVRQAAAREIGHFNPLENSTIKALVLAIDDPSSSVSFNAAMTLGGSGRPAVAPLVRYIKDGSSASRNHAIRALGLIGPEAGDAVKTLRMISRDKQSGLGSDADWALGKIAADPEETPTNPTD